jgi:hypothetical protein
MCQGNLFYFLQQTKDQQEMEFNDLGDASDDTDVSDFGLMFRV